MTPHIPVFGVIGKTVEKLYFPVEMNTFSFDVKLRGREAAALPAPQKHDVNKVILYEKIDQSRFRSCASFSVNKLQFTNGLCFEKGNLLRCKWKCLSHSELVSITGNLHVPL